MTWGQLLGTIAWLMTLLSEGGKAGASELASVRDESRNTDSGSMDVAGAGLIWLPDSDPEDDDGPKGPPIKPLTSAEGLYEMLEVYLSTFFP